jgi:hypothetical protein
MMRNVGLADTFARLVELSGEATRSDAGRAVEIARGVVGLSAQVPGDSRCDHLIESVGQQVAALDSSGDDAAVKQLDLDLRELHVEATRELADLQPDPHAAIKAGLRWVGPFDDAERVAEHFPPDAITWPSPSRPPESRFETTLRIGEIASRHKLDSAIGAALRQLPGLLSTNEGDEPAEHWWLGGRLEVYLAVDVLDGKRRLELTAPLSNRLGAWGADVVFDLYA